MTKIVKSPFSAFLFVIITAALCVSCETPINSDSQVLGNVQAPKPAARSEVISRTVSSTQLRSWRPRRGKETLFRSANGKAYCFASSHMRIDADGAPNAYHPNNTGLDHLGNAGYPNGGWRDILVTDPQNPSRPYVQKRGAHAGHFVSMTALFDRSRAQTDPRRYVDASRVPYFVFPKDYFRAAGTGRLGDIGLAIHPVSGKSTPFVVADIGPNGAALGEVSMALASKISGRPVNPRNGSGAPQGKMVYIIFPDSSKKFPWPSSNQNMSAVLETLLVQAGGDVVTACHAAL